MRFRFVWWRDTVHFFLPHDDIITFFWVLFTPVAFPRVLKRIDGLDFPPHLTMTRYACSHTEQNSEYYLVMRKNIRFTFFVVVDIPTAKRVLKETFKKYPPLTQDWTLQAIDSSTTTCSVYMPLSKAGDFQFKAIDLIGLNSTQIFCRRE